MALLLSCSSTRPPDVTPEMTRGQTGAAHSMAQLQRGRTVFASRCIECHALPAVGDHTASEWPRLIDEMTERASLKPAEREAVLAYILAARTYLDR
jgi:mono/diheme cytochrome c family protein